MGVRTSQGGDCWEEKALQEEPPATSLLLHTPCASVCSAGGPCVSGEQVRPCSAPAHASPTGCSASCGCSPRLPQGLLLQLLSPPSTGSTDTEVTQTPRHLLKGKAQTAKMDCVPAEGHIHVYWYRQKPEEELKFLVYFQDEEILDKTEMINERFSAQCPTNSPCSVEIQSTELGDLALYFCASSQSTVLKVHFPLNTNSACTSSGNERCIRLVENT